VRASGRHRRLPICHCPSVPQLDSHSYPDYRFRCSRDHGTDHPINNASMTNARCEPVVMMLFFAQYSRDGGSGIG
jgi:hypothetical protein